MGDQEHLDAADALFQNFSRAMIEQQGGVQENQCFEPLPFHKSFWDESLGQARQPSLALTKQNSSSAPSTPKLAGMQRLVSSTVSLCNSTPSLTGLLDPKNFAHQFPVRPLHPATAHHLTPSASVQALAPAPSSRETIKTGDLLHMVCCSFQKNRSLSEDRLARVVEGVRHHLSVDPDVLGRACVLKKKRRVYNWRQGRVTEKYTAEPYHYPLHMAVSFPETPMDVCALLAQAGAEEQRQVGRPNVFALRDGADMETPLLVAIKRRPSDAQLHDDLILASPGAAAITDRYGNTPLHVACQYRAGLRTVRHLVIMDPKAIYKTNLRGETPLRIAQTKLVDYHSDKSVEADAVVNFLLARLCFAPAPKCQGYQPIFGRPRSVTEVLQERTRGKKRARPYY